MTDPVNTPEERGRVPGLRLALRRVEHATAEALRVWTQVSPRMSAQGRLAAMQDIDRTQERIKELLSVERER